MEPSSIEKIVEIDSHIGCAMSGLIADAKTLIDKARVETQNHWFTYNETMTVESVTQAVSNLALQFGEEDADPGAMSRPFGVALLFGGVDEKGPQLFHMDPSGTFVQCDARAIGSASEGAQSSLQEVYHKSMTLKEAIKSSLVILKQVMEEKLNATNIEVTPVRQRAETLNALSRSDAGGGNRLPGMHSPPTPLRSPFLSFRSPLEDVQWEEAEAEERVQ
ncbi:PREDICTED: proteasome subunit alpha type-5 [Eurypyga helias]|uniref:proteasome subunit alpha type-5 n=1 Tax=Eurypyga helias TaxID=54383 RepID=UPI0005287FCE|nr:PREDICTED: proteasome subunit alpha type-5 [Eurypyga helias]